MPEKELKDKVSESTMFPLSIIGPFTVVLVLVVLWLGAVQSTASEARKTADQATVDNKQIILMYGDLKQALGRIEGKLDK